MSLKRLSSFLTDEELDLNCVSYTDKPASCMYHYKRKCPLIILVQVGGENALSINEGFFSWDAKNPPILLKLVCK